MDGSEGAMATMQWSELQAVGTELRETLDVALLAWQREQGLSSPQEAERLLALCDRLRVLAERDRASLNWRELTVLAIEFREVLDATFGPAGQTIVSGAAPAERLFELCERLHLMAEGERGRRS